MQPLSPLEIALRFEQALRQAFPEDVIDVVPYHSSNPDEYQPKTGARGVLLVVYGGGSYTPLGLSERRDITMSVIVGARDHDRLSAVQASWALTTEVATVLKGFRVEVDGFYKLRFSKGRDGYVGISNTNGLAWHTVSFKAQDFA